MNRFHCEFDNCRARGRLWKVVVDGRHSFERRCNDHRPADGTSVQRGQLEAAKLRPSGSGFAQTETSQPGAGLSVCPLGDSRCECRGTAPRWWLTRLLYRWRYGHDAPRLTVPRLLVGVSRFSASPEETARDALEESRGRWIRINGERWWFARSGRLTPEARLRRSWWRRRLGLGPSPKAATIVIDGPRAGKESFDRAARHFR